MKIADRTLALVLLAVSVFWTITSLKLPFPEFSRVSKMGPGHFPAGVGILMGLLALLLLIQSVRTSPAAEDDGEGAPGRPLLRGVARFAGYVLLVPLAGFVLASVVFIFVMVNRLGGFRWLASGVIAAAITAFLWLIFVRWLLVPLPAGPWGA
jgi:hypothetical protein